MENAVAKTKQVSVEDVGKLFLGQVITHLSLSEGSVDLSTKLATLSITPGREWLVGSLGTKSSEDLPWEDVPAFMANKLIRHTAMDANETTITFGNDEQLIITSIPDVETDQRLVYRAVRVIEQDIAL